ncbi:MAG: PilT protein putative toxin of system [Acidimicrobiales bacterium]|nr:PilT protein putative toxin of system [Acidimicrobiales bacterium]
MSLLLDTNALIRWLDGTISDAAAGAVADAETPVWVSAVSVWEMVIKASIGKLRMPADLPAAIIDEGFGALPVTLEHANAVLDLPMHHRDPFDRLLICQAQIEGLTVVTSDRAFEHYEVPMLAC